MSETNATNQRLAELLTEVANEVRELRAQQQALTDEVRKLAEAVRA